MSERKIWGVSERDFPAHGSPRKKLEFALTYATLAPTEGNWQPWYFHVTDTHIDLMTKKNPVREAVDPDRRGFLIGCGSALLYLKHTLKHFGCFGRIDLFPDLGQPDLVARLHFGSGHERDAREKLLFDAMPKSSTAASPLGEPHVTGTMLNALAHAATGGRGWLDFVQSETSRQHVLEATLAETRRWSDPSGFPTLDPMAEEQNPRSPRLVFAFGHGPVDIRHEDTGPEITVATAPLAAGTTKTDDKHGWLEAGQTLARTVLQAQSLGLSWAFFNPVQRAETRAALRTAVGRKGFAQVILRFGPYVADDAVALATPALAPEIFR